MVNVIKLVLEDVLVVIQLASLDANINVQLVVAVQAVEAVQDVLIVVEAVQDVMVVLVHAEVVLVHVVVVVLDVDPVVELHVQDAQAVRIVRHVTVPAVMAVIRVLAVVAVTVLAAVMDVLVDAVAIAQAALQHVPQDVKHPAMPVQDAAMAVQVDVQTAAAAHVRLPVIPAAPGNYLVQ